MSGDGRKSIILIIVSSGMKHRQDLMRFNGAIQNRGTRRRWASTSQGIESDFSG